MLAFGLLLLSSSGVLTARIKGVTNTQSVDETAAESLDATAMLGKVDHLFTFGAPHPTAPMLKTRDGGCFKGYRITAFKDVFLMPNQEDLVPTLLVPTKYYHPKIKTIGVSGKSSPFESWKCGDNPIRLTDPETWLHSGSVYEGRMKKLGSAYWRAKDASRLGLAISYKSEKDARNIVKSEGWRYVGHASWGEDVCNLAQDPKSLRCILTFEGSDSFDDFVLDAKVKRVSFCNMNKYGFHLGFRQELRNMTASPSWQKNIRPKLGKCKSVDVTGHSLGGAVATLFTACIDSWNSSPDFEMMYWNKSISPSLLPSI